MRAAKITVAKSLIARFPPPFRGAGFFVASGLKEWGQAPRPEGLPEKKAAPPCAGLHRPVKESVATLAAAANLPGNRPQMIEHLAIVGEAAFAEHRHLVIPALEQAADDRPRCHFIGRERRLLRGGSLDNLLFLDAEALGLEADKRLIGQLGRSLQRPLRKTAGHQRMEAPREPLDEERTVAGGIGLIAEENHPLAAQLSNTHVLKKRLASLGLLGCQFVYKTAHMI